MTAVDVDDEPLWTRGRTPPLCQIPWLGRFVVLSSGHVNFCCYSSGVVGDVNKTPLNEIWQGPQMQEIRKELAAGRLPEPCRSTSCPIYRGDERNYLRGTSGSGGPHRMCRDFWPAAVRGGFAGMPQTVRSGQHFEVDLWFEGPPEQSVRGDLFVALQWPDGSFSFLPEQVPFSLPCARDLTISLAQGGRWSQRVLDGAVDPGAPRGTYRLCAALFEPGADPNDRTKYYWSLTAGFLAE